VDRKMKHIGFITALFFVIFISCKKDVSINDNSTQIVPGQVQFTINDNVTLKQSMNVIRSIGGDHFDLVNFLYTKKIPGDSSKYYFNLFKNCSFITAFDMWRTDAYTMFRDVNFKDLDYNKYSKWDSIVKKESINEMPNTGYSTNRSGFLYVPANQEKIWIDKLKSLPEINSADYLRNFQFD
jgi:hypothetical protein